MRPVFPRPPVECLPSVSALIGAPLCNVERSIVTNWRWLGVVGLYVLSAITRSSQPGRHVDLVALFEGHDRALAVRALAKTALEHFLLAFAHQRVDALDLDVEQFLHRFLDLRLG